MILNCNSVYKVWRDIEKHAPRWKAMGAKYLLGFNEPDGIHVPIQTCDPKRAANGWLVVQKIANYFSPPLRLVSPAPISGGAAEGSHSVGGAANGGCNKGNCPWLNSFFEECRKLQGCEPDAIEFIAFHDYEGDFDVTEDNLQTRIQNLATNYAFPNGTKRKVWLTEITAGCGDTSLCRNCKKTIYRKGKCNWPKDGYDSLTEEEQLGYMHKVVPFLEASEDVYRYAWFGIRNTPRSFNGFVNLLPAYSNDLTPTKLGEYYRDAPDGNE